MRISVYAEDPGYANKAGKNFRVLLDGVEVRDCVTADEENRFVVVLARDQLGNIRHYCGKPILMNMCGAVRIEEITATQSPEADRIAAKRALREFH